MRFATVRRRVFLAASAALMAGFSPIPIPLYVVNETAQTIRVRRTGLDEEWATLGPSDTIVYRGFKHAGLCRPPDRWLPDYFRGLQFELPDGSVVDVPRATFEIQADYKKERWTYRYRGADSRRLSPERRR